MSVISVIIGNLLTLVVVLLIVLVIYRIKKGSIKGLIDNIKNNFNDLKSAISKLVELVNKLPFN